MTVPEGVQKIASGAFAENRKYRRIFIPESVTEIGDGAFRGCESLFELRRLSEKVCSLGEDPFGGCEKLVTATVCGMSPYDFAEEKQRTAAALGYCEKSRLFGSAVSEKCRKYAVDHLKPILMKAVDEKLTDAVKFFTEKDMLEDSVFYEVLEYAQRKKAMEIVAVLLDHRNSRTDMDEFSRYDI